MTHEGREETLARCARRYLWWGREDALQDPLRVIAEVMEHGEFEEASDLLRVAGEEAFVQALHQADPKFFRECSWSYWHCRLGLTQPGEEPPPLPELIDEEDADLLARLAREASRQAVREVKAHGLPLTVVENGYVVKKYHDGRVEVISKVEPPSLRHTKGTVLTFKV